MNTYRRFQTDEVSNAVVSLRFGTDEQTARTNAEGFYQIKLPRTGGDDELWLTAEARHAEISATHSILAPGRDAEFGIISDLDDTVIETNITRLLTAAKLTFAGNAKTRKPLEGVAALYSSLQSGVAGRPVNPIFYISTSPWNLYDLLCDFMELNKIPRGPLFLRDWGLRSLTPSRANNPQDKLKQALKIMADFPELPFVLIGDSGQHDAGIYAEIATLHPNRVKAIYIRDVDPTTATQRDDAVRAHIKVAAQREVPMLLAPNSQAMAHHAAELGLIPLRQEAEVRIEVEKDQNRPTQATAAVTEALTIKPADRQRS